MQFHEGCRVSRYTGLLVPPLALFPATAPLPSYYKSSSGYDLKKQKKRFANKLFSSDMQFVSFLFLLCSVVIKFAGKGRY